MKHIWTKDELSYIRKNSKRMSRQHLTEMFNAKFHTDLTVNAIKKQCQVHGYYAASNGRYSKGHKPWCKGMSKDEYITHFKDKSKMENSFRDTMPHDKLPIGTIIMYKINGKSIPHVVISDDSAIPFKKRIIPEHRYIWERYYGNLHDKVIYHLDGDELNNDISNLIALNLYERRIVNNYGWFGHPELLKTGVEIAKLMKLLKGVKNEKI